MSFSICPLDGDQFADLFTLTPDQLAAADIVERTALERHSCPCRVSLVDAEVGEKLLLFNYEHLAVASPYRSHHAIYVRRGAQTANPSPGEVPEQLRRRMLAVRGFDTSGMMIEAEIVDGPVLEGAIKTAFANQAVDYLHLHYAAAGCYAARVNRVD